MANTFNKFQLKRTSVSGRTPNTTNSANSAFLDTAELALNLTDNKLFSSNGSALFEIGSNLSSLSVTGTIVANTLSVLSGFNANTVGGNSASDLRTFAGNAANTAYTNAVSVAAADATTKANTAYSNAASYANTAAGTAYSNAVSVAAGDATTKAGTAYSNAISAAASDATTKAGTAYSNAVSYASTVAGTAYSNAVSVAAGDATTKAGTAYSNAVSVAASDATTKAGTAYSNAVSTAATDATNKAANAYSNAISYAGTIAGTAYTNAVATAATDATTKAGTAYTNAVSYAGTIAGTAYTNAVATAATDATTKAGTAYSNAISYSSNASNITSGTLNTARLPANVSISGLANSGSANVTNNLWVGGDTVLGGTLTISGNLTLNGNTTIVGANNLIVQDAVISLHTQANLAAWTVNDGKLVGTAYHYYDSADKQALLSMNPGNTYLTYYNTSTDAAFGDPTGTTLGTIQANTFVAGNTTVYSQLTPTSLVVGNTTVGTVNAITMNIAGNTSHGDTTITGFANVSSYLTVGGVANVAGALTVNNTAALGNTTITGNLVATGQTSLGGATGAEGLRVLSTASSVNYVQIFGTTAGNGVDISAQGSDASISMNYQTKNAGNHLFRMAGGTNFKISYSATAAVNYLQVTGSLATIPPVLSAQGSDSNVAIVVQPKGAGAIDLAAGANGVNLSNGGTVTAVTRTSIGSGYTSPPTWTASAPTTVGGTTASGTTTLTVVSSTLNAGGTGYTAGDVLTVSGGTFAQAAQITVNTVSSGVIATYTVSTTGSYSVLPTNPVSVTGGTGSSATFNLTSWGITSAGLAVSVAGSGYVEQPTITFSGGGGSGAAAYATVGSGTVIRSLGSTLSFYTPNGEAFRVTDTGAAVNGYWQALGGVNNATLRGVASTQVNIQSASGVPITFATASGSVQMQVAHTASAANYVQVTGAAAGNRPTISAQGSDAAIDLTLSAKSTGQILMSGGQVTAQASLYAGTNQANYLVIDGRPSGTGPRVRAVGTDANVNFQYYTQGTGNFLFYSASGSYQQFGISGASNAVNFLQVAGTITGSAPVLSSQGSDPNIDLTLTPKGNGGVIVGNNYVNYQKLYGGATGFAVQYQAAGSDTNVSMAIQPQGTGAIDLAAGSSGINVSNGGTVTAVTVTNFGSTFYSTQPTLVISAPTTTGGVQAVGTPNMYADQGTTVVSGGTGYTVGDTLTLIGGTPLSSTATFTVATVSSGVVLTVNALNYAAYSVLPSNPVSTTGGTGTGCTLSVRWKLNTVTITNAGSGYVEQPTVTLSGGGGSGAAAYATVGSATQIKTLGGSSTTGLSFYTPVGEQVRIANIGDGTRPILIFGGGAGGSAVGGMFQPTSTAQLGLSTNTGSVSFFTGGQGATEQVRVSHTASAVNYLQVTGAATANYPVISAQGSDSNVAIVVQPKGTGAIDLAAGSSGVNISNGGTVTALTRTAGGSGYTSFPSVAISAPTTAGGVQATATCTVMFNIGATIASGGTGYTVGDILTVVGGTPTSTGGTFTVTTVSSGAVTGVTAGSKAYTVLPTNPVSTTVSPAGGTGCTLNVTYSVDPGGLTIGTAGSGYVEQPTVTISGGGGSGATGYAIIGSIPTVKTLGSALSLSTPSSEVLRITDANPSALNYVSVESSGAGSVFRASGAGANPGFSFVTKGTGPTNFATQASATNIQLSVSSTTSAVNYVQVTGAVTGSHPTISTQGSDASSRLILSSKGTSGGFDFLMNNTRQLFIGTNGNAQNYLLLGGTSTGVGLSVAAQGADANVDINVVSKGTGGINLRTGVSTATQFVVADTASAVNYLQVTGAATTYSPIQSAVGTDTNISMVVQPKGTGAFDIAAGSGGVNISNGGTVTAIVRSTSGSNYTTNPTPTISAPTTTGGVQAVATCTISCGSATVSAGGSGYVVGEILTVVGGTSTVAAVLTVATVSGTAVATVNITTSGTYTAAPSNPAATTSNLSGTGATFTLNFSVSSTFNITTAGSGYVEQPTVSFSGGGGSGAAAYAVIGSEPTLRSLYGVATTTTAGLAIATAGGTQIKIADVGDGTRPLQIFGGSSTQAGGIFQPTSGATIAYSTNTGSHIFYTAGRSAAEQARVSHTASAVNYLQITGAATNGRPVISAQGSDPNVNLTLQSKGSFGFTFQNSLLSTIFSVVHTNSSTQNYFNINSSSTGSNPYLSVQGPTDLNIDLGLVPKGSGVVASAGPVQIETDTIITTKTLTTTATTAGQIIAAFASATYRSAEFIIQATDATGTKYQKTTILAIHNGTTAEYTEFGNVNLGGDCGTFGVSFASSNLNLTVTPASTNSTVFKVTCILTKV